MLQRAKKVLTICGCLLPIVLFFAAALYPVFSMVHENAHASVCQSNLRQLAVAFIEYSQDNDQAMPNIADKNGRNTWREAVYPYSPPSKDIYHCPDRYDNLDSHGFSQNYAANYSGNYGQSSARSRPGGISRTKFPASHAKRLPTSKPVNPVGRSRKQQSPGVQHRQRRSVRATGEQTLGGPFFGTQRFPDG